MSEYKATIFSSSSKLIKYLDKKRQEKKAMQSFEIICTFMAITFFLIFAIKPAIITIMGLLGEIKSKENATTQLRTKINQIVMAQDIFSQVQERYEIIESALPKRPSYAALALQIEGSGQSIGLDTSQLSFGLTSNEKNTSDQKQVSVNINQLTSFNTGLNFIELLKANRRLIKIGTLTFSTPTSNSEATSSGNINFVVSTQGLYWDHLISK